MIVLKERARGSLASASLLSWAPAGSASLPSGSSYLCDSCHFESGRERRKKGGRCAGGGKDPETAAVDCVLFPQAAPTGQHSKWREDYEGRAEMQRKGNAQRKEGRSKTCEERRPLLYGD